MPWDQFWKEKIPTKNQIVSKWIFGQGKLPPKANVDKAHHLNRNEVLQSRTCEADVQQLRQSHVVKVRMVVRKEPNLIIFRVFNQVTGAPYTDCFNPEEEWVITGIDESCPKCIIRHSVFINFHKGTMMQGLITKKSFSAQQSNFKAWASWVKEELHKHLNLSAQRREYEMG